MKLLYKILIISISLLLASSCITSYFFEEVEDLDSSKIHYKQAQEKLAVSVAGLSARCKGFHESLYNYETSYIFMTGSKPCSDLNEDMITGCAERDYFKKREVNLCITLIAADPCTDAAGGNPASEPEEMKQYRFSTFAYCSGIFGSMMPMPLFF
ncbi:hypothetical protein [Leptospira licerasiae]|uniref:Lipoprotein n=1 Tax=Leptospira licerasiae str. MMD4847 TaxID=1049971 RepID=A0ABP2RFL1_9LEPT|nr:hypothetical protein [Leptospira licerasiae]EIE03130.1 hypothetical protein LEP1GSC185_1212 [Leptospira licerasiae serovar Varillal str. VAR 010]EJZ43138.1 putative lipoprotein [Leptospira licerasiae str. MMD4847]